MASNQDLTKEFQKFVGIIIKNPERLTADMDTDDGVALSNLAHQKGLPLAFVKAGSPLPVVSPCAVAEITQDNVPANKPWGWCVQSIDIK